jgi:hypothetical protein
MEALLPELHKFSCTMNSELEVQCLIERLLVSYRVGISDDRVNELLTYYRDVIVFSADFRMRSMAKLRPKIKERKLVVAGWRKKF